MSRFWPRSLKGQLLLAVALALLLAQGFSAVLLYRAQAERHEAALIHAVAFRLLSAEPEEMRWLRPHRYDPHEPFVGSHRMRILESAESPLRPGEGHDQEAEEELGLILREQGFDPGKVIVTRRLIAEDDEARQRLLLREARFGPRHGPPFRDVLIAAVQPSEQGRWLIARVPVPPGERMLLLTLISQTLFIYAVIVGAIALILRRITRPLAALTERVEQFTATRKADGQLVPEGPDDICRLIVAHNAMEARIVALLDEKDVMLGAIGHDLKTPLAALRVRIESVEDPDERQRMAATIEDIVRSLDDILSLARVGRPSDALERTELSALVASVVEEYEDMGDGVELGDRERVVLLLRPTWLRRALRNLIDNALRYGKVARVSLRREGGLAVIRIEDDGPGIPESEIERMMDPFTRGEPSRNSTTGGAGLGLALARAIADQHGGSLELANRYDAGGAVAGLIATLRLPIA